MTTMDFSTHLPKFDWQKVGNLTIGLERAELGYDAIHFVGGEELEHLGPEGCEDLYLQWKGSESVVAVKIGKNSIDDDAAHHLSQLLQTNDAISYFCLYGNPISNIACKSIGQALTYNRTLVALQLVNAKIDPKGAAILANELELNNRSLMQLDLSHNLIQNDGAKAFAKALKVNDILTIISFAVNEIAEEGLNALVDTLGVNFTLCVVDLSENLVSDAGLEKMESLLARNMSEIREAMNFCNENAKEGPMRRSKLCFIGKDGVGKTGLINALKGLPFNEDYAPTTGVKMYQVQTRLQGDAWYSIVGIPTSKFTFQFLSRFANVKLDEKVEKVEKEAKNIGFAGLKKRRNRRGSIQQRRGSVTGTRRPSISGASGIMDDKSSVASRQSRRSSVVMSVLNAFLGEDKGLQPVNRVRRNSIKNMVKNVAQTFKRKKNDLLDDKDFVFYSASDATSGKLKSVYAENELDQLFDVNVIAKARRERDYLGFNIAELSGNRAFYTMHHAFLTEHSVFTLVFNMERLIDENDQETQKDEIRYLNYWLKVVKYHSPEASLLVVGTNAAVVGKQNYDKVEHFISRLVFPDLHREHAKRKEALKVNDAVQAANEFAKVLEEEIGDGTDFVDKKVNLVINAKDRRLFFPVELSTGKGVDKVRAAIDEAAQKQKTFRQNVPVSWLKFLDALRSDSPLYFCTPERVKALAFQNLENHEEEMKKALHHFHELGYIIHITEIEQLEDTVITNTLLFYNNIFKMVFTEQTSMFNYQEAMEAGFKEDLEETIKTAKISEKLLNWLWTDGGDENTESAKKGRQFLMEFAQLNLILAQYKFNGKKGKYIIPSLVRDNPKLVAETQAAYGEGRGLRCQFNFKGYLTLGVYERLVCLCIQYAGNQANSLEPILAMGWSQISFGMAYVFRLERMSDDIVLHIIEAKKKPAKLVANFEKMLMRIKQFLGKGFIWQCLIQDEDGTLYEFADAKANKLTNWFA